jgi:antitoxin (DNA-binding transcriptional repressor) of toxin-antitoxin stability system
MKKVSITEAKNGLSALIDSLKGGSSILIVDRGRPVACLEAVPAGIEEGGRVERLVREGIIRAARKAMPRSLLSEELPRAKGDGSVVAALIEERREGR